jgi:hypothetical protein
MRQSSRSFYFLNTRLNIRAMKQSALSLRQCLGAGMGRNAEKIHRSTRRFLALHPESALRAPPPRYRLQQRSSRTLLRSATDAGGQPPSQKLLRNAEGRLRRYCSRHPHLSQTVLRKATRTVQARCLCSSQTELRKTQRCLSRCQQRLSPTLLLSAMGA